jgi:hypothetical protein
MLTVSNPAQKMVSMPLSIQYPMKPEAVTDVPSNVPTIRVRREWFSDLDQRKMPEMMATSPKMLRNKAKCGIRTMGTNANKESRTP